MTTHFSLKDNNTTDEIFSDNKFVIYQLMMRLFGNTITANKVNGTAAENGVGKFNEVTSECLTALKNLGVDYVWFTGIIEHATLTDYSSYGIVNDNPDVVKGRAGSPYAIKDYYDVNPDLAVHVNDRMLEFESLIARSHQNKLKVLIDFIPNHVARSYKSDSKPVDAIDLGVNDDNAKGFDVNNNFYYLPNKQFVVPYDIQKIDHLPLTMRYGNYFENPSKVTGNDVFSESPTVNDWYETIKLNYGIDIQNNYTNYFDEVPDTWKKMTAILLFWASKKIDGFRCDMAEMVPVEFWNYAITEVKKQYPEMLFIAEIYNSNAYRKFIDIGKFDYLYDKVGLYDAIRKLTCGNGNVYDLTNCWKHETHGIASKMLRFMENHDEQRIASEFFAGNGLKAIPGMVASATMHSGPLLIYFGQEVGEPAKGATGFSGDDGRTSIFDYCGVPTHQAWMNNGKFDGGKLSTEQKNLYNFYNKLFCICNTNDAIKMGCFYELQDAQNENSNYNASAMFSYLRYTETEKLLIVCNFNIAGNFKGIIYLPQKVKAALNITINHVAIDLLSDNKFKISDEGVLLEMSPMSAVIIQIS